MTNYWRVMLGKGSVFADECLSGGYIGVDFDLPDDLTDSLPDNWHHFNARFIPDLLEQNPDRSKQSAGLACGQAWTLAKGMTVGDTVLSPDGTGNYRVGTITSEYHYARGTALPHRRNVDWAPTLIPKATLSQPMQNSLGSRLTVISVSEALTPELALILAVSGPTVEIAGARDVEDPLVFALEIHLEHFLVANWEHTSIGEHYNILQVDGETVGQQYMTDTGPIDILAQSKDGATYLVVELKRGRASDAVVGQTLRYMSFVRDEVAEPDQAVRGAIIAQTDDPKLVRALAMTPDIDFYRYRVNFSLEAPA